jgi:protein-S-isoprenylcysteine O-methyltransferase Ste14
VDWLHRFFTVPTVLSLAEWSVFSLYWNAAAKHTSAVKIRESRYSRKVHQVFVNLALALVVVPGDWSPRFLPDTGAITWMCLGIQTLSLVLNVWARRHLASNWSGEITIKVGHELIQSGPYRYLRHPIYTGILGMFFGAAGVSGHATALLGFVIALLAYRRKIALEEENLKVAFGAVYQRYLDRSRMGF